MFSAPKYLRSRKGRKASDPQLGSQGPKGLYLAPRKTKLHTDTFKCWGCRQNPPKHGQCFSHFCTCECRKANLV